MRLEKLCRQLPELLIFDLYGARRYCFLQIPQTELALWGSGAFKARGTATKVASSKVGTKNEQDVDHSHFAKIEPPVAAERRSPLLGFALKPMVLDHF